jgi:hypothetical protein
VMAAQRRPGLVVDERALAVRAGLDVAAVAAEHDRRGPAPVDRQDRLIAGRRSRAASASTSRPTAARGCRPAAPRGGRRPRRSAGARSGGAAGRPRVATLARPADDSTAAWRCRGRRGAGQLAERDRGVAGLEARRPVGLVGRVMLLVDHDETDARPAERPRPAGADTTSTSPLRIRRHSSARSAVPQPRVDERDTHLEIGPEPVHERQGEHDLGHETRGPAALQGMPRSRPRRSRSCRAVTPSRRIGPRVAGRDRRRGRGRRPSPGRRSSRGRAGRGPAQAGRSGGQPAGADAPGRRPRRGPRGQRGERRAVRGDRRAARRARPTGRSRPRRSSAEDGELARPERPAVAATVGCGVAAARPAGVRPDPALVARAGPGARSVQSRVTRPRPRARGGGAAGRRGPRRRRDRGRPRRRAELVEQVAVGAARSSSARRRRPLGEELQPLEQARRQHRPEDERRRREVVIGDPARELQRQRRQERPVGPDARRDRLGGDALGRRGVAEHDRDRLAPPELDQDRLARLEIGQLRRHDVGVAADPAAARGVDRNGDVTRSRRRDVEHRVHRRRPTPGRDGWGGSGAARR